MSDRSFSLLVVDDDRGVRELLGEFLSSKGFRVETVDTGDGAIELLKVNRYDIILLDLRLPDTNGIELLKRIKSLSPEIIAIIMTGYATLETAIQAIREGAYDYITKPFQLDEMDVALKNACERLYLLEQQREFREELMSIKSFNKDDSGRTRSGSLIDGIERIAALKERGLLTTEEFEVLKRHYIQERY